MIATIKTVNSKTFELNGINREKVFIAVPLGDDALTIVCVYNKNLVLQPPVNIDQLEIDGVVPTTVKAAVEALNPILFTKNIVSSSGAVKEAGTTLRFTDSIEGITHIGANDAPLTDAIYTADLTGAVEGGGITLHYSGNSNPTINGVNIRQWVGDITAAGTYVIYMHYTGGAINVNVFGLSGGSSPTVDRPVVNSATVEDANPNRLVVVFDSIVDVVNFNGLSLDGDWSALSINSVVSGSGTNTVTFGITGNVLSGQSGNFVYSASNTITKASSNDGLSAGGTAITNNVGAAVTQFGLSFEDAKVEHLRKADFAPGTNNFDIQLTFGTIPTSTFLSTGTSSGVLGSVQCFLSGGNIFVRFVKGAGAWTTFTTVNFVAGETFRLRRIAGDIMQFMKGSTILQAQDCAGFDWSGASEGLWIGGNNGTSSNNSDIDVDALIVNDGTTTEAVLPTTAATGPTIGTFTVLSNDNVDDMRYALP